MGAHLLGAEGLHLEYPAGVVLDRVTLYFTASLPMFIAVMLTCGSRTRHVVLWLGIVAYFYANLTHYGDLLPYEWSL